MRLTPDADYIICTFKLNHLEVFGLADAGMVMFGRPGKEFLAVAFCLYMIFVSGSAMVALSTALNAISAHGACTAIFVAVAAVTGFVFSSIRTLGQIMWLGWVGCVSIVVALLVLVVAVGTQGAPVDLPAGESVTIQLFGAPTFAKAMSSIASLVFACGGAPTFFGMISEMRDPREYPKALFVSQGFVTVLFCVIGAVTYVFCGDYVATPALGSAGPLLKKVSRICHAALTPGVLRHRDSRPPRHPHDLHPHAGKVHHGPPPARHPSHDRQHGDALDRVVVLRLWMHPHLVHSRRKCPSSA